MGPLTASGQHVASGLVLTLGAFDCFMDNAACFADVPPTGGGSIVHVGSHRVYIDVVPSEYPDTVLSCSDTLSVCSDSSDESRVYAEVFTTGVDHDADGRTTRHEHGSTSSAAEDGTLQVTIDALRTPLNINIDPAVAAA